MKVPNQKAILMEHIIALENKQAQDFQILKDQYHTTINSFSTLNLLKTSLQEVVSTPHLTSNIIQSAIDMGTQYLSKKFLNTAPNTAVIVGKIVQFALKKWSKK